MRDRISNPDCIGAQLYGKVPVIRGDTFERAQVIGDLLVSELEAMRRRYDNNTFV